MLDIAQIGAHAKTAFYEWMLADTAFKNKVLLALADAVDENTDKILQYNQADLKNAESNGMSDTMLDRLALSEARVHAMANGMREVAALDDPVDQILDTFTRPNGLQIRKVTVPIGVMAVIFEARPNVTTDAAALCLKAGSVVVLRGGKEAIQSNIAIVSVLRDALKAVGAPEDCIQLVRDTSHETAEQLMRLNDCIDVLIPRGGAGLIQRVVRTATVPVIQTGVGNCHIYIDSEADLQKAVDIVDNAKTSRPSVCNAVEHVLIDSAVAQECLPLLVERMRQKDVMLVADEGIREMMPELPRAKRGKREWAQEYLCLKLSLHLASDIDAAIRHIRQYSSGHSECIITENPAHAAYFMRRIDAAVVYQNASTRFTDGGEFGFGAEIGISTQKLHARGPLGLPQLVSTKYMVFGNGQIR